MDFNKKFFPISVADCLEQRTETFPNGVIVLGDPNLHRCTFQVIPCDNTEIHFSNGKLFGRLTDVRRYDLDRNPEYEPEGDRPYLMRPIGTPKTPNENTRFHENLLNMLEHRKIGNYTLRAKGKEQYGQWIGIDEEEEEFFKLKELPNFLFSFIDTSTFTGSFLDENKKSEGDSVNYYAIPIRFGAWGNPEATPLTLRYVMKKTLAQLSAIEAENQIAYGIKHTVRFNKKDLEKMQRLVLEDIKTGKYTEAAEEFWKDADAMVGIG